MRLIFLLQRTGSLILNSYISKNAIFNTKKQKGKRKELFAPSFLLVIIFLEKK